MKYTTLIYSSLASLKASIEEIAIWCNLHITNHSSLLDVLHCIEKKRHTSEDWLSPIYFSPLTGNIMHFSDIMLQNLFKVVKFTEALDDIVLSDKFVKFAKQSRDSYQKKANLKTSNKQYQRAACLAWFEIYAELCDILESKITKKHQSLQA